MSDDNQKKQDDQKDGVNPVAAVVTGAVVGAAAVGIAGAAVMANDDNRKKVEEAIDEAKDNVNDMKKDVDEKIVEGQEKVNEVVTAVKNSTQDEVKDTK